MSLVRWWKLRAGEEYLRLQSDSPKEFGSRVELLTKIAGDAIQVEIVRLFVVLYGLCHRGELLIFEERIAFSDLLGIRNPIVPSFRIVLVFVFIRRRQARARIDIVSRTVDDVLRM